MRAPGNPTGTNVRRALPPADVLRDRYDYDAENGVLRSRRASKFRPAGSPVGFKTPNGYLRTDMPEGRFLVHRIVWKMVTGQEPPDTIDHRDGDGANNRFSNLREADDHLNGGNAKPRAGKQVPLKGVFRTKHGRYTSQIRVRDVRYHLGHFGSAEAAHAAYVAAAAQHYGEFARAA